MFLVFSMTTSITNMPKYPPYQGREEGRPLHDIFSKSYLSSINFFSQLYYRLRYNVLIKFNDFKYFTVTLVFSKCTLKSNFQFIWPVDRTLVSTLTSYQSGPLSRNDNFKFKNQCLNTRCSLWLVG